MELLRDVKSAGRIEESVDSLLIVNLSLPMNGDALTTLAATSPRVLVHEADWDLWRSNAAASFTNSEIRRYSTGTPQFYDDWRRILDQLGVKDDRDFNTATHNFNRELSTLRLLLHQSPSRTAVEEQLAVAGGIPAFQDRLARAYGALVERSDYLGAADAKSLQSKSLHVVEVTQMTLDIDRASDWSENRDRLVEALEDWFSFLNTVRVSRA
jgi:hypothetical protein